MGIPKLEYIKKILDAIIDYNIEQVLENVNLVLEEGKDVNNFVWELIKFAKDLLIYKTSKKLNLYSEEELKEIARICEKTDKDRLLNMVYNLSELLNDIKTSSQKLIVFQAGLIKLSNKQQENTNSDLEKRVSQLEDKFKNEIPSKTKINIDTNNNTSNQSAVVQKVQKNDNNISKVNQEQHSRPITSQWPNIINDLKSNGKIMLYTNLLNTNVMEINDMTIGIEFPGGLTDFKKKMLDIPENKSELVRVLSIASGKEMNVKYIDLKTNNENKNKEDNSIEGIMSNLNIPFNVID